MIKGFSGTHRKTVQLRRFASKRDEKSKDVNDSYLGTFVQNKRKKLSVNKHLGNKRTRAKEIDNALTWFTRNKRAG